jgi:hypothetical protein
MNCTTVFFVIVLCSVFFVGAETVSLSGTVKETGSAAGIAGVKVSLAKLSFLSATTAADGSFTLVGTISVQSQPQKNASPRITLKGNVLIFSTTFRSLLGTMELFSSGGKRIASIWLPDDQAGKSISLPEMSSGVTIVRLTLNGQTSLSRVVRLGNNRFLKNAPPLKNNTGDFTLAKQTAVSGVDKLVAEKNGYMAKKVIIDSYSKNNITIILDSAEGNPDGHYPIPEEAELADVSHPDHIIGTGTPESCTPDSFIAAVAKGGIIVFNCGAKPTTITLGKPAKVFNDKPDIVIDGAGLVTLSGGDKTRILYMNTCDSIQHWTSPRCDNQDNPHLTVQNLTFTSGNAKNENDGGGAIFAQGGRLKIVNCRFFKNVCVDSGPDVGGAAVRAFEQYNGKPVYVVNSTFGGAEGLGNVGANGGGVSSIGVSWTIINCLFSYNKAIGHGGNPAQEGTPGGGSGGAIYNDGNTMTLSVFGTLIEHNTVNAFGSAIFFVSNDHSGDICIDTSIIRNNTGGSWYILPGISMHDDTKKKITRSTIE